MTYRHIDGTTYTPGKVFIWHGPDERGNLPDDSGWQSTNPPVSILEQEGYLPEVVPAYDPLTHKLIDTFQLVGAEWVQDTIALTALEIEQRLTSSQDQMWERVKAERERRTAGGCFEPVSNKWFHSDIKSRTQQLSLARKGDIIKADGGDVDAVYLREDGVSQLNWKTMDGSFIPMTARLAQNIMAAYNNSEVETYVAAETHNYTMRLLPDPLTYDYSAGWPLIYGE